MTQLNELIVNGNARLNDGAMGNLVGSATSALTAQSSTSSYTANASRYTNTANWANTATTAYYSNWSTGNNSIRPIAFGDFNYASNFNNNQSFTGNIGFDVDLNYNTSNQTLSAPRLSGCSLRTSYWQSNRSYTAQDSWNNWLNSAGFLFHLAYMTNLQTMYINTSSFPLRNYMPIVLYALSNSTTYNKSIRIVNGFTYAITAHTNTGSITLTAGEEMTQLMGGTQNNYRQCWIGMEQNSKKINIVCC